LSEIKVLSDGHFDMLSESYLFTEVRRRTALLTGGETHGLINLSIGDVAYPIPEIAARAMVSATEELADNARFRGYPAETGYDFLKNAVCGYYRRLGFSVDVDEIFIGDGSKTDTACFTDIFERGEVVIPTPTYPVYMDNAVLRGNRVVTVCGSRQNGFLPTPEGLTDTPKMIWICSPNNPAGSAYDYCGLKKWVDFALSSGSVILFDAAYSAFCGEGVPKSVYEIEGASDCAVEFYSLSKAAGFTNLRCSWTVVPKAVKTKNKSVNALWKRRQSARFNGVCYPVQRAAEAVLSDEGRAECKAVIDKYKRNTRVLGDFLKKSGVWHTGGEHSPYVWLECPAGLNSWETFDLLIKKAGVVGTPGCGFGRGGEGYFRLSGFTRPKIMEQAIERLEGLKIFI